MEQNLRIPGPTPLPDDVRAAQAAAMIDHRGTEFAEMLRETSQGIGSLIGASGDVLLLTGSGTGGMEAAIVNTLSPGDRVLSVNTGGFGDRFAAIATAFGAQVDSLAFEWGTPADPARLREQLATHDPYAAVLITHNETSTGVTNPLQALVAEVHRGPGDPLAIVDGISGLGAIPFQLDAWGVDVVVSASR
jgi:aspartate aminotransferase-like enzyme